MRWTPLLAVLLLVPVLRCAMAQEAPLPRSGLGAQKDPGKRQGEAFTFSLKLGPIEGGRARLAITPPQKSGKQRLIHVIGQAEAVGMAKAMIKLRNEYRTLIDADTLLPRHIELVESGLLRSRTVKAEISGRHVELLVTRAEAQQRLQEDLPVEPRDPIAAFLAMRTARLRDGDRLELLVLEGSGFLMGAVEVAGRELLDTPLGQRRAILLRCKGERITGKAGRTGRQARQGSVWLSDDEYRVPLRIEGDTELGKVTIELTSYEPPRRPLQPPSRLPGVRSMTGPGG